jgi:hydroxymethylpyrimidine/phosphomethylpyrimidine kinase
MRTVLTIAGSDSSGGAGIAADLKTFQAVGCHGACVVTAITAQNSRGVQAWLPVPAALVRAQLESILDDLRPEAIKTGMMATAAIVRVVAEVLSERSPTTVVCDPVLASSSGHTLVEDDAAAAVRELLIPLATVVTPNVPEAEALTGRTIQSVDDAIAAARDILGWGVRAVVLKGGHLAAEPGTDLLVSEDRVTHLPGAWIASTNTHGTGCVFSAALASQLARRYSMEDAVRYAKGFTTDAIRHGYPTGRGSGVVMPR